MPNISSRMSYEKSSPQASVIADSLYSDEDDNESTRSTFHATGCDSPTIRNSSLENRLTISNETDGRLYEWFQITDRTIEYITLDIFAKYVDEFFGIQRGELVIRDIDGPIETSIDLRRSLRTQFPTLSVSARGSRNWLIKSTQNDTPQVSPTPYKAPKVRVHLTKSSSEESLGFSNMASKGSNGLVITRIAPGGLLSRGVPRIRVGDTVDAVNRVSGDLDKMRRELMVSDRIVLDV